MASYTTLRLFEAVTTDQGKVQVHARSRCEARQKIIALLTKAIRGTGRKIGKIGDITEVRHG